MQIFSPLLFGSSSKTLEQSITYVSLCMLRMMVARLSKSRTIRHSKQKSVDLSPVAGVSVRAPEGHTKEGAAGEGDSIQPQNFSVRPSHRRCIYPPNKSHPIDQYNSFISRPWRSSCPCLFFSSQQVDRVENYTCYHDRSRSVHHLPTTRWPSTLFSNYTCNLLYVGNIMVDIASCCSAFLPCTRPRGIDHLC